MNLKDMRTISETKGHAFFPMVINLIIGFILAVGTFLFVQNWEEKNIRNQFTHVADLHLASLEREIKVNFEVLRGVWDFLAAEPAANRHQFNVFTRESIRRFTSIQALEWIPRVPDEYRSYYEASAKSDGLEGFQFTERIQQGFMVQADKRPEYYPVYFVEPVALNKAALGFDLASNPVRFSAIEQSRDSGEILATAPLTLVQEKGNNKEGFLVFLPIYDGVAKTLDQRRNRIKGFVLGVFRVNDIFDAALKKSQLKVEEITIRLVDHTEKDQSELLHVHQSELWGQSSGFHEFQRQINIAGRVWDFAARPTADFIASRKGSEPYLFSTLVLFITITVTFYIGVLQNRSRSVSRLVKIRTQELTSSESKVRAILDTVVHAVITIDDRGNIQQFNPGAEVMFGYSIDDVKGKNVKMLMPEPYQSEHDHFLERYLTDRDPHIIGIGRDVKAKRKDGSVFPISLSVGETRVDNKSVFVGVITDITLQKEAELALVNAKEQAETSNRMKTKFVNMMSHELRTPLTVILGYIPVLKKAGKLPGPELVVQIAEDIQHAGDHLLNLINDLLDISKIEAGKLRLNFEKLLLKDVVEQAVSTIGWKAKKKGIGIVVRADECNCYADRIRIQQVLINLIGNATKFTDAGEIIVTISCLEDHAEISVEDNGCGISEKDQQEIFKKFHQVDDSSTRAAGGTGLGLAITKYLVELHGGNIKVESSPGEGSTFTFTIPVVQEEK